MTLHIDLLIENLLLAIKFFIDDSNIYGQLYDINKERILKKPIIFMILLILGKRKLKA